MLIEHFDIAKTKGNFSNARYVRNLYEKVKIEQSYRISTNMKEDMNLIKKCDIEKVVETFKSNREKLIKIGFSVC